jgi:hypothetical protein
MENFEYTKRSRSVIYNGQSFDSLLELKFILSVEDTHAWMRDGLQIYYNAGEPDVCNECFLRKYTPDILIRNWSTGEASLVEIKPDHYDDYWANKKRKRVASSYITEFGYDWTFRIIYERDIKLTSKQQKKYETICRDSNREWFGSSHPNQTIFSNDEYEHFVCNGGLPAFAP